jgi:hypothetical protein
MSNPQLLHMDNLVWVTYPYRQWHIEMARDLLADRHLHQLPYSQFNPQVLIFKKLAWGDPWTASKSCRSKLYVTGDTAKYLVFNPLQRWCTFCTRLSQPLLPWCLFCSNGQVKTKTRPFRSNPSDQPRRVPSYHHLPPSARLAEFSQLS